MVIAREKGWKIEGKEGDDDGRVINTQYSTQMVYGRIVFLKSISYKPMLIMPCEV